MLKTATTAALAAILLSSVTAMAGPTAEQKCEGGKNQAAGKYAACVAKAEKTLVLKDDLIKYGEALVKCEGKLTKSWGKLEAKAVDAGTVCPSEADQTPVEDFLDACGQSVAAALAGGTLGLDPVACATDLAACDGDLTTCGGNLGTCTGDLGTCTGDLATASSDLFTCSGNLAVCSGSLSTCSGDLATANGGTAAPGDVLAGKTFTSASGLNVVGTVPAGVDLIAGDVLSGNIPAGLYSGSTTITASDADLVAENIKDGVDLFGVTGTLSAGGGLPKTGQNICYNTAGSVIACAGTGHDGELQKGVASSYTDNGDGTITDNLTGLMWEKQSDDGSIHDKDDTYTWDNAFASKVATLNSGSFAGHTDWRVPNRKELESLVNLGAVFPATFSAFNASCAASCTVLTCSCTRSSPYWSSSTYQDVPTNAWYVDFYDGGPGATHKANIFGVRAVRAGS